MCLHMTAALTVNGTCGGERVGLLSSCTVRMAFWVMGLRVSINISKSDLVRPKWNQKWFRSGIRLLVTRGEIIRNVFLNQNRTGLETGWFRLAVNSTIFVDKHFVKILSNQILKFTNRARCRLFVMRIAQFPNWSDHQISETTKPTPPSILWILISD